jgi:ABC-type sugar transport system ATPase subunit
VSEIVLSGVRRTFSGGVKAVDGISLEIGAASSWCSSAPPAAAKTTLLRMIAGLDAVDEGSIRLGDRDITHLEPRSRDIAMVFQNYALYPHMNVRDNLSYRLRVRKTPKHEIERRVDELGELLGLHELLDRLPPGFISAAPGTGAALSWILFVVVLVVTLVLFASSKLWVFYGSD